MPDSTYMVPVTLALDDFWPQELVDIVADSPIGELLAEIGVTKIELNEPARLSVELVLQKALALEFPGLNGVHLVFGSDGAGHTIIELELNLADPFYLGIHEFGIGIRFPRDMLRPVILEAPGRFIEDPDDSKFVEIAIRPSLGFSGDGTFFLDDVGIIETTTKFMIGDSGVVLDIPRIAVLVGDTAEPPTGYPEDWEGVFIETATIHLPPSIEIEALPDALQFTNCGIGNHGFTGEVAADWSVEPLRAQLFGFGAALKRLAFSLEQNAFKSALVEGELTLDFFEATIGVRLSLSGEATFSASLFAVPRTDGSGSESTPDGLIVLSHADLLTVSVDDMKFDNEDGVFRFTMTGRIKPLLGGIDWPEVKVEKLSIDENGNVDFDGGWLNLPEQLSLDLGGFKITISELGFGNEEEVVGPDTIQRHWIGISGGIRLLEGIPMSASVEGLKVSWNPEIDGGDVRVSLRGVAVSLEIPGTLRIAGAVSYEKMDDERFKGDIVRGQIELNIIPLRMEIAGDLIIGHLTEKETGTQFDVAYVVINAQFPTAIPLGATGAGLYGLLGLVGVNVAPDRHQSTVDPEEPEAWYEWYKADRGRNSARNVTKMQKWTPKPDSYAFGAGLTVGTVYDDGYTVNVRALLAVLIPGPIIMIEGRANLLQSRSEGSGESAAFYALAVFDGIAGTFQLNIDVQYELEDVITIGAGVEAFFNFNDSTDWHIWIGQKDPESKRVRAAILSIFQVSAYLMIDNNGLLTGAKAALEIRESYGPLTLELALGLSFDAAIFWSPLQLEGRIELFGAIVLKLLGFGIEILLRLMLEAKAPKPFWVHGVAEIKVSLPFPLPSFEAKVEFTWEEPIPPDPIWPLLKGVELGHDLDKEARWLPTGSADVLPIVPVDAIPVAKFSRPLAGRSYARTDEGLSYLGHDEIDDWTFTYVVGRTQLFKVGDAEPVAASPLPGGDIGEMLPLDVSDQSLVTGTDAQQPEWRLWRYDELVSRSTYEREDLAEGLNPCGGLPPPPETCVDFRGLARGRPFARSFTYRGLCFRAKRRPLVRGGRLSVESLWIRFEKPMARVRLELARAATVRAYYDGEQAIAPTGGGAADSVYTILLERDEGIDAVHIEALSAVARVDFDLKKVCTLSRDDADDDRRRRRREDDARDAGGDTADRLILEPNSDYRLVIETHVLLSHQGGPNELNESATATDEFFFRTGNGPSAEEPSSGRRTEAESRATPLLAEGEAVTDKHLAGFDYVFGSINDVSRYVGLTLPDEGEPLFYYDLDVEVLFSRLHMSAMYTEGFTFDIQIRDRNGKLIEPELPAFLTQWAFSSPGLMTWLAAADRGGCGDPSRRTGADAVMGSWAAGRLRPNRGYVAELVIRSPSSVRVVHEFSFTTSQYGTPTELLRAGLIEGALLARIESATGATLPAPTLLREAATAYGTLSDKRAVLKLAFDASNRLQTSDLQDETSNLRTAFVTAASAAFEELRSALSLTVDSQVRPPRVELIGHDLGLDAGGLPQLLLRVDGPEPLDWSRFSWTLEQSGVTSPTVLVPIPSADGTTAFFASTDRAVTVPPGEYELTATYLSSDARDLPEHHTRGAVYEPLALELPFQLDASG